MNPITQILNDYPLIILDGALATELERRGCDLRDPIWSAKVLIEAPQLIKQVHADYFAASADCATTASYQATFAGLVSTIGAATSRPFVVYPNSGETYLASEGTWAGEGEVGQRLAEQARTWYERGARIIGGCCRTTPAEIQAIAAWARR